MGSSAAIQNSFNAGELSPKLEGRVDVAKYGSGAKVLENFIPVIQGPAVRRGGFRYLGQTRDNGYAWLVPFQFNVQQAYVLEFGNNYIRIWKNRAPLGVDVTAPAWSNAVSYAVGAMVFYAPANSYYYCAVANVSIQPDLNPIYWRPQRTEGLVTVYEIPTVWSSPDLIDETGRFNLRMVESADVMYICHPNYQPYKLQRFSEQFWRLDAIQTVGGPFQDENITTTTVYADAATGTVNLTASSPIFTASDVGSLFKLNQKSVVDITAWQPQQPVTNGEFRRSDGKTYLAVSANVAGPMVRITGTNRPTHTLGAQWDGPNTARGNGYITTAGVTVNVTDGVQWAYQDPGFGIVQITGYTSPTQVSGVVVPVDTLSSSAQLPAACVGAGNASTRWSKAAWSSTAGWPTQVNFFRQRLCFARDQTVWMSVSGDFENFAPVDGSNLVTEDSAISATLASPQVNKIRWMEPCNASVEAMVVGTAGNEFAIRSQTENQPFGPNNVTASSISAFGSINARPIKINSVLLFAQAAGVKVRDVVYDFYGSSSSSASNDQTILAEHITKNGINAMAYQQEPYSLIWAVRQDGQLICMTYSREQYPEPPHGGWHRHPVGGGGIVESLCVIPAPDLSRDELWASIRFNVNGVSKRYLCIMDRELQQDADPMDSFYVDAGKSILSSNFLFAFQGNLIVGANATVAGATDVRFKLTAGQFPFSTGQLEIHYTYAAADNLGNFKYLTAKAQFNTVYSPTEIGCTIFSPWPNITTVPAGQFRYSSLIFGSSSPLISTNLMHLEGAVVSVLADGSVHPDCQVTNGQITLQRQASKVSVGFPYKSRLKTMRMNQGARDGTSQGKKSRITKLVIRFLNSLGMKFGKEFDTLAPLENLDFRTTNDLMDNATPLFTGDKLVEFYDDWEDAPYVCVSQEDPLPCTVVALMPQVTVIDRG